MEQKKSNLTTYISILGAIFGFITATLAVKQYFEGKELRAIQKRLSALQLEKAELEKKNREA